MSVILRGTKHQGHGAMAVWHSLMHELNWTCGTSGTLCNISIMAPWRCGTHWCTNLTELVVRVVHYVTYLSWRHGGVALTDART